MSRYRCVFRDCSTVGELKGQMPASCKLKGCTGKFNMKPGCKTFMQDVLPPEPIMTSFNWGEIKPVERRFNERPHFGILTPCKLYPTLAVARV